MENINNKSDFRSMGASVNNEIPVVNPSKTVKNKKEKPVKRKKSKRLKAETRKRRYKSLLVSLVLLTIVLVSSATIIYYTLACVNDIFAMNRSKDKVVITISSNATTDEVIDLLADKDLIENKEFCKMFNRLLLRFDEDTEYIAGVYELSPSMGLEVMLTKMSSTATSAETVILTFPEGYTCAQIIEKLAENGVCSAVALRQTMETVDFSDKYTFLPSAIAGKERYHLLEGYLFPDTYEFYLGENCSSVIGRFLTNFNNKWTEEFSTKATELNFTLDEVLTLASIIEKEAYGSKQMTQVSSILHNRLNDTTGHYKYLACDSTTSYIPDIETGLLTNTEIEAFSLKYNTYLSSGLPIGPICNPGIGAIKAALNPEETTYFFFCHDKNRKIYLAETDAEHNANLNRVLAVNSAEE